MLTIRIYIIPWILFVIDTQIQFIHSGFCQQQAQSSFQFHNLGRVKSKEECHKRCCKKNDCNLSIFKGRDCFGITCTHKQLCKSILGELSQFEGHQVNKRSLSNQYHHAQLPINYINDTLLRKPRSLFEVSDDADDSDDEVEDDDDNNNNGNDNDDDENIMDTNKPDDENDTNNDELSDNDEEKDSHCKLAKFKKATIPKRKKSFKFKKLSNIVKELSQCNKRCCQSDECLLAFILEDKCYGVMCVGDGSCHTQKDKLPGLQLALASVDHKDMDEDMMQHPTISRTHHKSTRRHSTTKKHKLSTTKHHGTIRRTSHKSTKKHKTTRKPSHTSTKKRKKHKNYDESRGENDEGDENDDDKDEDNNNDDKLEIKNLKPTGFLKSEGGNELHDDILMLHSLHHVTSEGLSQMNDDLMSEQPSTQPNIFEKKMSHKHRKKESDNSNLMSLQNAGKKSRIHKHIKKQYNEEDDPRKVSDALEDDDNNDSQGSKKFVLPMKTKEMPMMNDNVGIDNIVNIAKNTPSHGIPIHDDTEDENITENKSNHKKTNKDHDDDKSKKIIHDDAEFESGHGEIGDDRSNTQGVGKSIIEHKKLKSADKTENIILKKIENLEKKLSSKKESELTPTEKHKKELLSELHKLENKSKKKSKSKTNKSKTKTRKDKHKKKKKEEKDVIKKKNRNKNKNANHKDDENEEENKGKHKEKSNKKDKYKHVIIENFSGSGSGSGDDSNEKEEDKIKRRKIKAEKSKKMKHDNGKKSNHQKSHTDKQNSKHQSKKKEKQNKVKQSDKKHNSKEHSEKEKEHNESSKTKKSNKKLSMHSKNDNKPETSNIANNTNSDEKISNNTSSGKNQTKNILNDKKDKIPNNGNKAGNIAKNKISKELKDKFMNQIRQLDNKINDTSQHYGHKEDIFKEFQAFKKMFEDNKGHIKGKDLLKLSTTEFSGDGSGESPHKNVLKNKHHPSNLKNNSSKVQTTSMPALTTTISTTTLNTTVSTTKSTTHLQNVTTTISTTITKTSPVKKTMDLSTPKTVIPKAPIMDKKISEESKNTSDSSKKSIPTSQHNHFPTHRSTKPLPPEVTSPPSKNKHLQTTENPLSNQQVKPTPKGKQTHKVPIKTVPTVAVDGVVKKKPKKGNKMPKNKKDHKKVPPPRQLNVQHQFKEESIKDLSKEPAIPALPKPKPPKKIPSLNINIEDDPFSKLITTTTEKPIMISKGDLFTLHKSSENENVVANVSHHLTGNKRIQEHTPTKKPKTTPHHISSTRKPHPTTHFTTFKPRKTTHHRTSHPSHKRKTTVNHKTKHLPTHRPNHHKTTRKKPHKTTVKIHHRTTKHKKHPTNKKKPATQHTKVHHKHVPTRPTTTTKMPVMSSTLPKVSTNLLPRSTPIPQTQAKWETLKSTNQPLETYPQVLYDEYPRFGDPESRIPPINIGEGQHLSATPTVTPTPLLEPENKIQFIPTTHKPKTPFNKLKKLLMLAGLNPHAIDNPKIFDEELARHTPHQNVLHNNKMPNDIGQPVFDHSVPWTGNQNKFENEEMQKVPPQVQPPQIPPHQHMPNQHEETLIEYHNANKNIPVNHNIPAMVNEHQKISPNLHPNQLNKNHQNGNLHPNQLNKSHQNGNLHLNNNHQNGNLHPNQLIKNSQNGKLQPNQLNNKHQNQINHPNQGKIIVDNNKKNSQLHAPVKIPNAKKKESPIEIIQRLLGNDVIPKTPMPRKPEKLEIVKKPSSLDDFFNGADRRQHVASKHTDNKNHNKEGSSDKSKLVASKPAIAKLDNYFDNIERLNKSKAKEDLGKKKSTVNNEKTKIVTSELKKYSPPEKLNPIQGCSIKKDLINHMFIHDDSVGYLYKVKGLFDANSCMKQCCDHDTCHIAVLEDQVCNLLKCKNRTICDMVVSTNKRSRLIFLEKSIQQPIVDKVHSYCPAHHAIGVPWEKTREGSTAIRSCPRDAIGKAKRQCDSHSHWLPPDFTDCVSKDYASLVLKASGLGYTNNARDLSKELDDVTTQTIDNSLIFGGDIMKATQTISNIATFLHENDKEDFEHQHLRSVTRTVSNLFDETNKQEWSNMKPGFLGPAKLMKSLDLIGLYTAKHLPHTMQMKPVLTRGILISAAKLDDHHENYVFPNYSIAGLKGWTNRKDSIQIPKSILQKTQPTLITSATFKTLSSLLPHRHVTFTDGFVVNSNVISSTLQPAPQNPISPPVTIVLHHLKVMNAETKCVFWDFNSSDITGGSWSTEGCWLAHTNRTTTICKCNHLTHFALLSNTNDQKISIKEQAKEHTMAAVWLGIPLSVVIVIAALYTCFAWSKTPRRRHVVIMDKKPVLPDEDVIVTKTVSEKYLGSPDRHLYASNFTPSPSELEWEHAWDFLTNSDFDEFHKKQLKSQLKDRLLKQRLRWEQKRRGNLSTESSVTTSTRSSSDTPYNWRYQFTNCRRKLTRGEILDMSSEPSQPLTGQNSTSTTTIAQDDCSSSVNTIISQLDAFSPVAISSPHSASFEENNVYDPCNEFTKTSHSYLQISFDAEVEEISEGLYYPDDCSKNSFLVQNNDDLTNFIVSETYNTCRRISARIETESISESELPLDCSTDSIDIHQELEKNISDELISSDSGNVSSFDSENSSSNQFSPDDVTQGLERNHSEEHLSYSIFDDASKSVAVDLVETDLTEEQTLLLNSKLKSIQETHLLSESAFSIKIDYNKRCHNDCCHLYIDLLFEIEEEEEVSDVTDEVSLEHSISDDFEKSSSEISSTEENACCSRPSRCRFNSFLTPIKTNQNPPKLTGHPYFKNTSRDSFREFTNPDTSKWSKQLSCEVQRRRKKRTKTLIHRTTSVNSNELKKTFHKEVNKLTGSHASNPRPQTPHMKSYIALRQQCRRNDSMKNGGTHPQVKPKTSQRYTRRHSLRKVKPGICVNTSSSKLDSPCRSDTTVTSQESLLQEIQNKNRSRNIERLPIHRDQKIDFTFAATTPAKPFYSSMRHWNAYQHLPSEERAFQQQSSISDKSFKRSMAIRKDESEKRDTFEKRAFRGHLKRWHGEELVKLF